MPAVLDSPAVHDLKALKTPLPIVLKDDRLLSPKIPFRITERAHARWPYARVRFAFTVELVRTGPGALGYVDMQTGTGPSAAVEFLERRDRRGAFTQWTTANIDGSRRHVTRSTRIEARMWNLMLYPDSTAGVHQLTFRLERFRGFRVKRVVISPRSSIQLTKKPAGGRHDPRVSDVSIAAGELTRGVPAIGKPMRIQITVSNPTDSVARNVRVSAALDEGVRLAGGAAVGVWPNVPPHGSTRREFTVVPRSGGKHRLILTVRSARSVSSGVASFEVPKDGDGGGGGLRIAGAVLAVALAGGGTLALRRTLRRRSSSPQ